MSATVVTAGIGHNPKIPSRGLGGVLLDFRDGGYELQTIPHSIHAKLQQKTAEKKPGPIRKALAFLRIAGEDVPITRQPIAEQMTEHALRRIPQYRRKIKAVRRELGVSQREARQKLVDRINKEIAARKAMQDSVFKSDGELIEILLAAEII